MGGKDDDDDFGGGGDQATTLGVSLFATAPVPDYLPVSHFGDLDVLGLLARGGMAEVFLARERSEDGSTRHLVLKKILATYAEDPRFLEMFEAEGRMAMRLYHPNVCHVYDCGRLDGTPFITLEWVHGVSLRDVLRRADKLGKRLPVPLVVEIIAAVADALHYVHHATGTDGRPLGIIHRDVSPHNVMLGWNGQVKLLDFGIAKTTAQDTQGGQLKGKIGYVSPEQLRNLPLDTRCDIFSLGVCLYEALVAERLYHRENVAATFSAIVEEAPPVPSAKRPDVPPELDAIVLRALAKDRADRYQTAGALRDALRGFLEASGHRVYDLDVASQLSQIFEAAEKAPLPEGTGLVTGAHRAQPSDDSWSTSLNAREEGRAAVKKIRSTPPPARGAPVPPPAVVPSTPPAPGMGKWVEAGIGLVLLGGAIGFAAWLLLGR